MFGLKLILAISIGLLGCRFEREEAWYESRISSSYEQYDRIGLPYLNILFPEEEVLAELRLGDPSTDIDQLKPLIQASASEFRDQLDQVDGLQDLSDTALSSQQLATKYTPNVLKVDATDDVVYGYENGRNPTGPGDDTFDVLLKELLGRDIGDDVNENSNGTTERFPFLVRPVDINEDEEEDETTD